MATVTCAEAERSAVAPLSDATDEAVFPTRFRFGRGVVDDFCEAPIAPLLPAAVLTMAFSTLLVDASLVDVASDVAQALSLARDRSADKGSCPPEEGSPS